MSCDDKNNEESVSLKTEKDLTEKCTNDTITLHVEKNNNISNASDDFKTETVPEISTPQIIQSNGSIPVVSTPKVAFANPNRIRIISKSDLVGKTILSNGIMPKVIRMTTSSSGKTIQNIHTLTMSSGAPPSKIIRIKSDRDLSNKISISSLNAPVVVSSNSVAASNSVKKVVTIQTSNATVKPPLQLQMNHNSLKLSPKTSVNIITKSSTPSTQHVTSQMNSSANFILLTPTTMSFAAKPMETSSSLLKPISNSIKQDVYDNVDFNGRKNQRVSMNNVSSNSSTWQQYVRQYAHLGPCPICEDSISGYHYGIFCCESCKGFFKRSVQNHKDYVCHVQQSGGEPCGINKHTRKKCPSCRFRRCVDKGMRIEAVRNDRSRGGRSLYPGSRNRIHRYSFPDSTSEESQKSPSTSITTSESPGFVGYIRHHNQTGNPLPNTATTLQKNITSSMDFSRNYSVSNNGPLHRALSSRGRTSMMSVLDNIVVIEEQLQQERDVLGPILEDDDLAVYRVLLKLAEQRLHRMVRWSRALPEFSAIDTDDQIMLVQNCWAELLILDCCYRSLGDPREIHLTAGKCINLEAACELGAKEIVEFIVRTTQKLKSLSLDIREYACLKVLLLMQPDLRHLKAEGRVRLFQETVSQLLLDYTHDQLTENKFYELVTCVPEIRSAALSLKQMLVTKDLSGFLSSNSLLLELLNCNNNNGTSGGGNANGTGGIGDTCTTGIATPAATTSTTAVVVVVKSELDAVAVTVAAPLSTATVSGKTPHLLAPSSSLSSSSSLSLVDGTSAIKIISVTGNHNHSHPHIVTTESLPVTDTHTT